MMISRRSICVHLAALALIVATTFFNSLHSSFKMDDHDFFNDPKIKNPKLLVYNWIPEPDRYLGLSKASEESGYRPVTNTALAVKYHGFGRNVQAYHVVMIVLFFIGCAMIYVFVLTLCADALLAFLTSVLFAVHPINGLAVNYVVASAYTYQLILAMACMICFVRSYQIKNYFWVYFLSISFFLLSLGVHETSIILPIYLVIIAWYMNREPLSRIIYRVAPFFALLGGYLLFRMRYASLTTGVLGKFADFQMSFLEYTASFVKLIYWYLSQLILPDGVVLMWSTEVVRQDWLFWIILGGFLMGMVLWSIRRNGRSMTSFALILFFIGFGPILAACLFRPTTGLIMEPHWMFLSAVGFFIVSAQVFVRLIRHNLWIGIIIGAAMVLGLIKLSHAYNDIWADDKSYGYYWLQKAPAFKTTKFFIAYSLMKDRRYAEAREVLLDAREGIFSDWQIYSNLGLMDFEEGDYNGAIDNYQKALTFNPFAPEIYNNLALISERSGNITEAVRFNKKALELNRFLIEPRLNLARIAIMRQDYPSAFALYRENLGIVPNEPRSLELYFAALADAGEHEKLEAMVLDILKSCQDAAVLTDIGNVAAQKKLYVIALDLYMQALRIDSKYAPVYVHAGVLLANLKEFDRAVGLWEQALTIDPADDQVAQLIKQAQAERQGLKGSVHGP